MDNKPFKQLMEEARQVKLEASEKTLIKQELLSFMDNLTVIQTPALRLQWWSGTLNNLKLYLAKPMVVAIILSLVLGGSVSAAAGNSLPGDWLYPVKVNINEEVRGWLTFSNEAEADWHSELATRRIEEGEKLAAYGELSADVRAKIESNFEEHAERVQVRIDKFEMKNISAAADIASNFEASLEAHDRILGSIGSSVSGDVKIQVKSLQTKIKKAKDNVNKYAEKKENEVTSQGQVKVESAARGRLNAAENKINEVKRFLGHISAEIGTQATAQAQARLNIAQNLVVKGKTELDSKNFSQAFSTFGQALFTAQEAKLLIEAKYYFEIRSSVSRSSPSSTPQPSLTVSPAATGSPGSTSKISPSPTSSIGTGVKSRGRINIDIDI